MALKWDDHKLQLWYRLWEDLEIGYLDTDILPIIVEFFARPKAFTSSSCSGRIVLMDVEYPWEKDETMIVFKKHEPITVKELKEMLEKKYAYNLWLSVQGPIYHVYVKDLGEAKEVLEIARSAGFKHSGVLVVHEEYYLLELRTGIRLNIPLLVDNKLLIDPNKLETLVYITNGALLEAKSRNERLLRALRSKRPNRLWKPAEEKMREMGWLELT